MTHLMHDIGVLTDTLNEVLERAEKALKGLRHGVAASVPLDDEGRLLAFKKHQGQWGLCVSGPDKGNNPSEPWQLLRKMPRRFRILAAKAIPDLYEALLDEVNLETIQLQNTIGELEEFVETLEAKAQDA